MDREQTGFKKGTTLIETVVAVSVLMLFISGLCGLALYGKQLSDRAGEQYRAINIAKNRLERTRNSEFDVVSGFAESNARVNETGTPDSDGRYRRTTTVSTVNSNLVEVAVQVDVLNRRTLQFDGGNVNLRTYIARYMEVEEDE